MYPINHYEYFTSYFLPYYFIENKADTILRLFNCLLAIIINYPTNKLIISERAFVPNYKKHVFSYIDSVRNFVVIEHLL